MRDRVYLLCLVLLFALPTALHAQCAGSSPETTFYVNQYGHITRTLSETEGPATVCIAYNRLRFDIENIETFHSSSGPTPAATAKTGQLESTQPDPKQLLRDVAALVRSLDPSFDNATPFDASGLAKAYLPSTAGASDGIGMRLLAASRVQPDAAEREVYQALDLWRQRFAIAGLGQELLDTCKSGNKTCIATTDQLKQIQSHFALTRTVSCSTFLNKSIQDSFTVKVYDEIDTANDDGQGKVKPPVENAAFVTVTCASRVSLSAGVALSTVPSREFAIIPSAGSTSDAAAVSKFGLLSDSSIHPVPIALTHYRFLESKNHLIGYTATIGIAANIQGTNAGSTSVEYLAGASIVFGRFLYITPGVYFGTETKLAGGFKVGDAVPSNYGTTIQLTKSYEPRFGIAFSFSKP